MGFWIAAALFIGSLVVGQLLRPRPRFGVPQPSSLGDFDFPTATEDRVVPLVVGTVYQRGANVLDYGDLESQAIVKDGQTVGYRYYLTVQWGICLGPVDFIERIDFDERTVVQGPLGPQDPRLLSINAPTLYGGDDQEGGVSGTMAFYYGTETQLADPKLESMRGGTLPAYPGLCHAVARHMYLGNSPYVKPPQFAVKRFPNSLGIPGGRHIISGGDANPIAFIYEIYTNDRWGKRYSSGQVDLAAFLAAADVVHSEGIGISMLIDKDMDADDLVADVLRHIDGLVYHHPITGLLTIKLARFDYSVPALPLFDETNVKEVEFSRLGWEETANVVKVRYVDREAGFKDRIAQAQDLANIQIRGGEVVVEEVDYRGISTAAAAQKLAAKTLVTRAFPLSSVRFVVNRTAWDLFVGDAFRFKYGPLGIGQIVMRVTNVDRGTLRDGKIEVHAVEDVFAVAWTAYGDVFPPDWNPPEGVAPIPVLAQRLLDSPYGLVARTEQLYVLVLAVHDVGVYTGYEVHSHPYDVLPATPEQYERTNTEATFTPSGTLQSALGERDVASVIVVAGPDMNRLRSLSLGDFAAGKGLMLIDDELIAWQAIVDNLNGTHAVSAPEGAFGMLVRGAMDTTPKAHAAGARVFFLDGYGLTEEAGYPDGGHAGALDWKALRAKVLPFNLSGTLPIASATGMLLLLTTSGATTDLRVRRPFVPRDVKHNGVEFPVSIVGGLTLAWLLRNRLGPQRHDLGGVTVDQEISTVYEIDFYGELGTLVRSLTGLVGNSNAYPLASEITESGLGRPNRTMRTVLRAKNTVNGYLSFQRHDWTFDCSGYGMLYGSYYGGGNG